MAIPAKLIATGLLTGASYAYENRDKIQFALEKIWPLVKKPGNEALRSDLAEIHGVIEQQAALLKQKDAEIAALVQEIEDQRQIARRNLIVAAVLALTSLGIAAALALKAWKLF